MFSGLSTSPHVEAWPALQAWAASTAAALVMQSILGAAVPLVKRILCTIDDSMLLLRLNQATCKFLSNGEPACCFLQVG